MPTDTQILECPPPITQSEPPLLTLVPNNESKDKKATKKTAVYEYIGLWVTEFAGNEPVAYFHPSIEAKAEAFAKAIFGEKYVFAKVKIESRPPVTRYNPEGAKNVILDLISEEVT